MATERTGDSMGYIFNNMVCMVFLNLTQRQLLSLSLSPSMPELATHSHDSSSLDPLSSSVKNPKCPEAPLFMSDDEQERIKYIQNYEYYCDLPSGYVRIRKMKPEEVDCVVELLAYGHGEVSRVLPENAAPIIKEYLMKKGSDLPRSVILVALYRDKGETKGEEQLVGTLKLDSYALSSEFPIPVPESSPYASSLAVKNSFRRKGIAWHLLKAMDELIRVMSPSEVVYAHAVTNGPLGMYHRAGYNIITTKGDVHLISKKLRSKM